MMTQINGAELPYELLNIEIMTQMSKLDGPLNVFRQHAAKFAFQFQNLVPDLALDESPQRGRYFA